jgi:hypothetical protein
MDTLTASMCVTALQEAHTAWLGTVLRTRGREHRMRDVCSLVSLMLLVLALAPAARAEPVFSVSVPGKTITLAQSEWAKMEDPTTVAHNFEERKKGPWHQFGRVVTIFLHPMTDDRRVGLKIADREYVEIFVAQPGLVTVQTRIDKGTYWVMCRETFLRKAQAPPVDLLPHKPSGTDDRERLWFYYQDEIDTTRHLLHSRF